VQSDVSLCLPRYSNLEPFFSTWFSTELLKTFTRHSHFLILVDANGFPIALLCKFSGYTGHLQNFAR